jgi:hypothetical protein
MNLKSSILIASLASLAVSCGGKTASEGSSDAKRTDAEIIVNKGDGSQLGGQQGGQQGPGQGNSLLKCEFKSADGLVNCGALNTVLVPEQETLSRFEVKYEFNCGQQGLVSPISLESGALGDQSYQRRAFIFSSKSQVSLYGKGPLKLESRKLGKAIASGLDLTGCVLLLEVVTVEPALEPVGGAGAQLL